MTDAGLDIEKLISTFNGELGKVQEIIDHKFNLFDGQVAALTEVVVTLLNAANTETRARALKQLRENRENWVNTKEASRAFEIWEGGIQKSILFP